MSPRTDGRRSPCTITDARARLHDAAAFLEAAKCLEDPDVIATNAIHAAAIELRGRVDKSLAAALKRAFDRKNQAAYESRDISVSDASMCVRQADLLVAAARQRILSS